MFAPMSLIRFSPAASRAVASADSIPSVTHVNIGSERSGGAGEGSAQAPPMA